MINEISKTARIGWNVKIWHFTYIGDNTEIGDNTKIGSLTHIDYNVKIGRDCKIEGQVYIPPLTEIRDRVFIAPGVIFTNDPHPTTDKMVGVYVDDNCIICAGAILKAGITIGQNSVIGMGAVVVSHVPPNSVVFGNPAKIKYSRVKYDLKQKEWLRSA